MQIKKGLELLLGIIEAWWSNQCLRRFPSQIQLMILKPCKGSWILYGFRNLKGNFRGDSMVIINSLQDEVSSLALFGHLIDEVKILAESFTFMSFSHVCYQCNSIAYYLVRHAKHVSSPFSVDGGYSFISSCYNSSQFGFSLMNWQPFFQKKRKKRRRKLIKIEECKYLIGKKKKKVISKGRKF